MANDLTILEQQLQPLAPHLQEALSGVMPVDRLLRTAMIAVEKNPRLAECNRQSFFNAIMSAGVLGLEMDGVTGQAFLIPFKDKVQLVMGYKGFNTLAARAGLTITGNVVYEGDQFEYQEGTGAFVRHVRALDRPKDARIIAAWAQAEAKDRPPIIAILSIAEILAIKAKSPGAKKSDSPWNDPAIGFPAMASKSAKRRLARSLPLNIVQLAARMDEAFEEQGVPAHITASKELVIETEASPIPAAETSPTPSAEVLTGHPEAKDHLADLKAYGWRAAQQGMDVLREWWDGLPAADRLPSRGLVAYLDHDLKPIARKADEDNEG